MKYLSYIAVFILGLAVASIINMRASQIPTATDNNQQKNSDQSSILANPAFSRHLANSENIPMESRHRDELKRVLMEEWASHDPKGFLIAWKDRAWPDGMWNGPASLAMEKLARLSPELLLEFARTEGCDAAWLAYLAAAHPLSSLELLNETKKGELPENVMEALVMRGMEINPEFHRHLERINDPELREEALIVVATSMFATRRLDELAPIIKTLKPTGKPEEKLVNIAAAQMMEGDLSLSELQVLPEEFLSKVIVAFLNHETPQYRSLELSIDETIHWVDDLVQTGWAQGKEKDILRFVEKYSSVGELRIHSKETDEATLRREYSAKWLHVVDKIPAELGEIKIPLIMTAIHFHQSSPTELKSKIADARPFLKIIFVLLEYLTCTFSVRYLK